MMQYRMNLGVLLSLVFLFIQGSNTQWEHTPAEAKRICDKNAKVRLFLDRSCVILSSFKIVVIFNNTPADFVLISADV